MSNITSEFITEAASDWPSAVGAVGILCHISHQKTVDFPLGLKFPFQRESAPEHSAGTAQYSIYISNGQSSKMDFLFSRIVAEEINHVVRGRVLCSKKSPVAQP
jgi:hypothetical protein